MKLFCFGLIFFQFVHIDFNLEEKKKAVRLGLFDA